MIIVRIMGGLGNQMFQYAIGRKLQILNNDVLKLDITDYYTNVHEIKRSFKLDVFNVIFELATVNEIKKLKTNSILEKIGFYKKTHIKEKITNVFDEKILSLNSRENIYLDGYWQNERYFKDIRDILLKEFTLKVKPSDEFINLYRLISNSKNSVGIHIRGGDYFRNKKTREFLGLLSLDYYKNALNFIESRVNDYKVFVFTDDLDYALNHLKINKLKNDIFVVSNNKLFDYEELILMSGCQHLIISNSSFSWWGAYLGFNNKIVISPKNWFSDFRMKDINPSLNNWVLI